MSHMEDAAAAGRGREQICGSLAGLVARDSFMVFLASFEMEKVPPHDLDYMIDFIRRVSLSSH